MQVTLYIPCYNAGRFLNRVLPAVMAQTYPIEEVLIIDDGSPDNTLEVAARYREGKYPLRIIRHDKNRGLAAARNTGVKAARTELVASLDADCVPAPDWLEHLMQNLPGDRVAGVGGQLRETEIHCLADRWRAVHMQQWWGDKKIINPEFLFGHSNVFYVKAIARAGYYDEKFRRAAEDYHMTQALYRAGFSLIYEPRAVVNHIKTDTISSVLTTCWRYGYWGFENTLTNLARRVFNHLRTSWPMVFDDFRHRRWAIAGVSVVRPFWAIYQDTRMYLSQFRRRNNPAPGP